VRWIAPLLAITLLACTAPPPPKAHTRVAGQAVLLCGDLLATIGKKPPQAEFVECTAHPERQGKPLHARYRVPSKDAAAVENYLAEAVGMARLRRSCCQWDGPPASFRDTSGQEYSILLLSPDTPARDREEWPTSKPFEIWVDMFTEEI
jgi:hypothetical protein